MIRRRNLLVAIGAAALAPRVARGQSKQPVLIGCLVASSRDAEGHRVAAFKQALAALGWKEGVNLAWEERWADGRYDRLQPLAEELAAKKPALMVVSPTAAAAAAAKAAPSTPIVMAGGDPLAAGLVSNLARPGGLITGVSNVTRDVNTKHVELLLDAVPKLRHIGFLSDPNVASSAPLREAARRAVTQRSIDGHFADVGTAAELEAAIRRLAKEGTQALAVGPGPMLVSERHRIVKLALTQRWPIIAGQNEFAEAGALLAYGADRTALYRRAAYYVDRILKGAKPGDLPIEQATKFELVLNMKTAKTLGLTIPERFMLLADRVIE